MIVVPRRSRPERVRFRADPARGAGWRRGRCGSADNRGPRAHRLSRLSGGRHVLVAGQGVALLTGNWRSATSRREKEIFQVAGLEGRWPIFPSLEEGLRPCCLRGHPRPARLTPVGGTPSPAGCSFAGGQSLSRLPGRSPHGPGAAQNTRCSGGPSGRSAPGHRPRCRRAARPRRVPRRPRWR